MSEPERNLTLTRRGALIGASAALAASALSLPLRARQQSAASQKALPPAEALERLVKGSARYAAGETAPKNFAPEAVAAAEQRNPVAAVLACSGMPVPAERLFDQGPGELFVVGNAGNVVTPTVLASLEFAVTYLGVSQLMVLGHSNCRAVGAAFQAVRERKELPGHLPELVKAVELALITAHGKHPSDFLAVTIEENVRINKKRLVEKSQVLKEAVTAGKAAVSGAVLDLGTGKIKLI
jgi:carbonic anhydrase